MAETLGSPAGTGGTGAQDNVALPEHSYLIGYVDPIIGRQAHRAVSGYFGFPVIKAGQTVTKEIAERAQNMGRLFELIAATEEE